jgi:DNA helicase II / ATP-dependent DNA helicase PcrA
MTSPILHAEQQAVVDHTGGPLLVVAGAGSGKTMTLAARLAELVWQGASPERLLLMTFSRRAAAELGRRAGLLLQQRLGGHATRPAALPWSGTFHSVAARLLRLHAVRIGLPGDFGILDRADAEELMGQVRQALNLHRSERRFPTAATCLSMHSRCSNGGQPLAALLAEVWPWCEPHHDSLRMLFRAYAVEKQRQHLLDLDDLLLYWHRLMQEPLLATAIGQRFDHVLVDEYQDTNPLQSAIVQALKPTGAGLVVVGDDAQAIYGFRGASVAGMLGFPACFDPPARRITLSINYRSTPQILAAANAVMADAGEGFAKVLTSPRRASVRPRLVSVLDESAQARWVAEQVLREREQGLVLKRQAVLFRTAHHSVALELELTRRAIPFVKYGGLRFFESAHVKDLLAVLRWAQTPRARLAGQRVLRLVPGIGVSTAARLLDALDAAEDPWSALLAHAPSSRAADEWQALRRVLLAQRNASLAWPAGLQEALHWYLPHLQRLHADAEVRAADLQQLARLASGFASAEHFLAELALDPPAASSDEAGVPLLDDDYLVLSTIHSAKGQEWRAVTVLNVVDGCMPSDMSTGSAAGIEEERRLLYVAMTRAQDSLNLMLPQRFHLTQQRARGDRHVYAVPSRFLTPSVQACCDHELPQASATGSEPEDGLGAGGPVLDVAAWARQRFIDD